MNAKKSQVEILKQVKVNGPLTYNELEELCHIELLKDRGLFAKNLRILIRKNLINISKIRSTTHYTITSTGLALIKKSLRTGSGRNA